MLLTNDQSKLEFPPELGLPVGQSWRGAEVLGDGLFIALMTAETFGPGEQRTLVLCWDSDIVHFIESPKMMAKLCALHHFQARREGEEQWHRVREIREIWRGTDGQALGAEVLIFKATDGSSFCGREALPIPSSVQELALIAHIEPRPPAGSSQ